MTEAIRIIGVDPGLNHTGWGIIESIGSRLVHVASGIISTHARMPLAQRLLHIHTALGEVIAEHAPHEAAIEETFVNRDARATLKLGHARGAAMLALAGGGLPVAEYAPNRVKKTVTGVGHADKRQVAHMVAMLLPQARPAGADAADALAVAICHAHCRAAMLKGVL